MFQLFSRIKRAWRAFRGASGPIHECDRLSMLSLVVDSYEAAASSADDPQAMELIQESEARLSSCVGPHEFKDVSNDVFECQKCRGLLLNPFVNWYQEGRRHERESAELLT